MKIVFMENGDMVMVCSCRVWEKHGHACRHMYKILRRRQKIQDAKVRWHLRYLLEYGRNEEVSRKYMYLRDHLDYPGVPITKEEWSRINGATKIGHGDRDLPWFERSYEKLYLRGGLNTYWAKIRDTLPVALQQCIPCDSQETNTSTADSSPCPEVKAEEQACELGFQAGQQETSRSSCIVPSQMAAHESPAQVVDLCSPDADNNADVEIPSNDDSLGFRQGTSAYHDFMPMYTQLCTMADGRGERAEGCQKNMRKKLQEAKREMFRLNTEHENIHGMASHPKISTKKVARRRRKATSPNKRRKKGA